jgi:hypothetical protein
MPTRGIVESSPEDDKTILPMNALLPQASQSSVLEKSDPASSSKASLVAQQKLGDFFPSLTQDSTASIIGTGTMEHSSQDIYSAEEHWAAAVD